MASKRRPAKVKRTPRSNAGGTISTTFFMTTKLKPQIIVARIRRALYMLVGMLASAITAAYYIQATLQMRQQYAPKAGTHLPCPRTTKSGLAGGHHFLNGCCHLRERRFPNGRRYLRGCHFLNGRRHLRAPLSRAPLP